MEKAGCVARSRALRCLAPFFGAGGIRRKEGQGIEIVEKTIFSKNEDESCKTTLNSLFDRLFHLNGYMK